jgi:hypothetical protein
MEQSPFWKADSRLVRLQIARLLRNLTAQGCAHKSQPLADILGRLKPLHNVIPYSFKIKFSINHPPTSKPPE